MATLKNTTIDDVGFLKLPAGTTEQRPAPAQGQLRYNTTLSKLEAYNSNVANWIDIAYLDVAATGGSSVYEVEAEGTTYKVHVFTTTGNSTFTVTNGGQIEYLIVAGGGGGSGNFYDDGGGGGAGGVITGFTTVSPQAYTITVGTGGAGSDGYSSGGNTVAFGLTALGGGGGGGHRSSGGTGGSGGGAAGWYGANDGQSYFPGAATQPGSASGGFGNQGGGYTLNENAPISYPQSSGGGGAGGPGGRGIPGIPGQGGIGISSSISGINTFYGGGGGGISAGIGGIGGGANASTGRGGVAALPGTPNTGGGGGAGRTSGDPGAPSAGGSGIVIVRYPIRQKSTTNTLREVRDSSLRANFNFATPNSYPGVGDRVYDSEFNEVSGALVNAPTVRDFKTHRSSLSFNGSNQHIRLENFRNRPSTQVTCEAWVFPRRAVSTGTVRGAVWSWATTYLGITDSVDGGANHSLHWAVLTSASRSGAFTGSIPRNNWSHIVGTYDGARTKGYINGVLVYDVAQTGTLTDGTYYIGTYAGGINDGTHNWDGNIADARLYNRALSIQEILNNFNVNRWRFGI